MKTNLIYATSNPGKIIEIGRHLGFHGLAVSALSDFSSAKLDPEENGTTLGENARIKALAYAKTLAETPSARGQRFIIVADDTGLFMRGLGGEPGIKVRRWIGRTMTDEELIDYALERLEGKTGADRDAEFKTVICMVLLDEKGDIIAEKSAAGALKGHILKAADPVRIKGFPFESLFFADEYGMLLGNLHRMSDDEKRGNAFNNHRERALEEAVLVIKKWMA